MLEDRSTIYAKVAPERIADVNWIMEGYEHLALVSTIDHQEGIILSVSYTHLTLPTIA